MVWPFRKRRRTVKDDIDQPATEKAPPEQQPTSAATLPQAGPTPPIAIPRTTSKREAEELPIVEDEKTTESSLMKTKLPQDASHKENVPPSSSHNKRASSREDITALPVTRKLDSSPHLRPIDSERPHIPYNFRPYSSSQTSIQREPNMSPSSPRQPNKLQSRRSAYDSATPSRRPSSKRRKDPLREEEIRAMGAHSPIPKRPGDGPLRRDSKKMRGYGMKDAYVSLPADDDVDSNMTGVMEQRGWELGSFDLFNPRPAVRLSGTPQYVTPSSLSTPSPIAEMVRKDKEKAPVSRDRHRKRETIGVRADDLDATDLRVLMERDAKRRDKRKQEQQEKLDRKLRDRNGRNRGDSDRKKREAEEARQADKLRQADEARQAEEARQRAEEDERSRELMTSPTAVHPALRDTSAEDQSELVDVSMPEREPEVLSPVPVEQYQTPAEQPQNPFTDAAAERVTTPAVEQLPGAFSPVQTPMEEPVIETAREMPMTQTETPPLSPVRTGATASSFPKSVAASRASDFSTPPPITDQRRQSDPKPDRRAGAWATFFRRGGTNLRKASDAPPSEGSFSNTSRESMRNQPLPPHLVDTQAQTPRRKSGTPVRTQSKFREDLPEMPISPPDSRLPSPDVTNAAAAAAARRRGKTSTPVAVPEDVTMAEADQPSSFRNDTPISPSIRSNRITSMGSVDSEASWMASGAGKRHSTQSGVNRSIGSLNQRFTGSYEELGRDNDGEHFQRMTSSSPDKRSKLSSSLAALTGETPDEESDEDGVADLETPGDPITMHEGVRRKPTLVHRDPRMKSREGLLTENAGEVETPDEPGSTEPTSAATGGRGSLFGFDDAEEEPEMKRASSVDYGSKGHARQISAGSARLIQRATGGGIKEEPPLPNTSSPRTGTARLETRGT